MTNEKFTFRATSQQIERIKKYMLENKCTKSDAINALLSENTAIEPQVEVIRGNKEDAQLAKAQKLLDMRAKADHEHTLEVQKRELAKQQNFTSQADKVTDWGVGHSGVDTSTKINPPNRDLLINREEQKPEIHSVSQEDWEHHPRHIAFIGQFPERRDWNFDDWVQHDREEKQKATLL